MIHTVKNALKKAKASGFDTNMALLCIRTTPIDSVIPSPAEIFHGRKVQSNLPLKIPNTSVRKDSISDRLQHKQDKQKEYYDKRTCDLPPLIPGHAIRVQHHATKLWSPATVQKKCPEPRSYLVSTPNDSILRRNCRQLQDIEPTNKTVTFSLETAQPRFPSTPQQPTP